jgi:hypothetical protein
MKNKNSYKQVDARELEPAREEVLNFFYSNFIIPLFAKHGYNLPLNVKVSIGLLQNKKAIGSAYHPIVGSGYYHIFIAPKIAKDAYLVFTTLIHEAIHTLFFNHLHEFSQCAAAVGLLKPWTSTTGSDKLENEITQWLADNDITWYEPDLKDLHDIIFPGGKSPGGRPIGSPPKQKSRMIKLTCPDCGYLIRTSRTNIESKGLPGCPCGNTFEE